MIGLRQPDARSCGAAAVVMARLLHDGTELAAPAFRDEVLEAHRRLTRARLHGHRQLPWPRALGTPPWAVDGELRAITGREHTVSLIRCSPAAHYDRLALTGGALYVGSPWLPRHVVLVLPGSPEAPMRCYQPARGSVTTQFAEGRLMAAGWPYAWFSVSPAAAAGPGEPPASPR